MPSMFGRVMSYVYRKEAEKSEKPDDFEALAKEGSGESKDTPEKKKEKCDVCGRVLTYGVLTGNVGGKCRICQRKCCCDHFFDTLCPYCREKLGKTPPAQPNQSRSLF